MSYSKAICFAAVASLSIACVSTEALAWRGGGVRAVGVRGGAVGVRGGAVGAVGVRGGAVGVVGRGVYGGNYWRPGVGAAVATGVAVGAVAAVPYAYRGTACGYYPYPPCY